MKREKCQLCLKMPLSKDEIAINKKLIDPSTKTYFCLNCLADYLDCSVDDLEDKIEEFKNEGCTFFK